MYCPVDYASFGESVDMLNDVTGDGIPDFIIGAPNYAKHSPGNTIGAVFLCRGNDGASFREFFGPSIGSGFGGVVANAGDLDGNGQDDILIGAALSEVNHQPLAGEVYAFSPISQTLLGNFSTGEAYAGFGSSLAPAGDLDGDGVPEVIIGAPRADGLHPDGGKAYVYSWVRGLLFEIEAEGFDHSFGSAVIGGADLNGDALADVAVAASVGGYFKTYTAAHDPYLSASSAALSAASGGHVDFLLDFPSGEAGKPYVLLASATGTGPTSIGGQLVPLTSDWLFQMFAGGNPPGVFGGVFGALDGDGEATVTLDLPPGAATSYIGTTFFYAGVSYDPPQSARLSSDAVSVTVQP